MIHSYFSPAKINLCLHVLAKRPDGYHELAMLMQRLSLGDTIELELTATPGVTVECPGVELPPGGINIAARAAQRMLELRGQGGGVRIRIDKQIPVAAGLGGGSSNAATVLLGLNTLLDLRLTKAELMAEGVKLGADVPFFILEEVAWATGIGDRLEPLPALPLVHYLLVNPGIAVSTAWVYQNLGLTGPGLLTRLPRFPESVADLVSLLHNDLERVTIKAHPEIAEIKQELLELGAAGALMSGSGATVFGLFAEASVAQQAAEALRRHRNWRLMLTDPV